MNPAVSFRHYDKFYAEVYAVTLYHADGYLILTHANDDSSSISEGAEALFEPAQLARRDFNQLHYQSFHSTRSTQGQQV